MNKREIFEKLVYLCDTNNGYVDEIPAYKFAEYLMDNDVTVRERGIWHKYCDHFTKRQVGWICTNCSAVSYDLSNGDTQFCPHCGALMDLEE